MQDYEKLGVFYLGKSYALDAAELKEELILYDSKDLTTHAVIIGMTGSGKTGLGISLLEEAALDHIPVIAIDPKGDLGNLLLTFPELQAEDFESWVDSREAQQEGKSVKEFARAQAELWKKGLGKWGQTGERIRKLRDAADFAIYTPGSSAGLPISVLSAFRAPAAELQADGDLYRERVQSTATSILALLGISADPITDREHVLIANILEHCWNEGRDLDLAGLIGAIQKPPIERIGVLDTESFYPSKERFALAMRLNNLLAAPGFESWLEGEPLEASRLLYTATGRPRVSVISIAHLPETQRMFFVSMLLNEVLSWVRTQPGTSSVRAILYMDEIFGYLPPTANPPSKPLFLTLLKQARAYGLGLVLATQNPVDLDYKALSNTGTWFIGRLQTERDKARVMDGLEGVAAGGHFDKQAMEQTIAGLGKRVFLMHNVHETEPVVFHTRWAMSYLPGPLTREQIKQLTIGLRGRVESAPETLETSAREAPAKEMAAPILPPGIRQYYLPLAEGSAADAPLVYYPYLLGVAAVGYTSVRYHVHEEHDLAHLVEIEEGAVPVDWADSEQLGLTVERLQSSPREGATYAELPTGAASTKNFASWEKLFKRWIRTDRPLTLYRSLALKQTSSPSESERDFRIRLQQVASERRDVQAEKLRKKYAAKVSTLENRLQRAEQRIESEQEQAKQRKLDAAIAAGTALLSAFLGRKRISTTSASRVGTAAKSAGRIRKETADVQRARETADRVREQLTGLQEEFERELDRLDAGYDAQAEELKEILIKPKSTEIHVHLVGLAWAPHYRASDGRLRSAWQDRASDDV